MTAISFEYFPPKTAEQRATLAHTHQQLKKLGPEYFSVTFGAGGSTQTHTVETVLELERYLVFANNSKGKKLKKIYDHRFPHLMRSGEIEKIFAKWNW